MGGGGIYVTLVEPLKGYTESDAVSKLGNFMWHEANKYDEICGKNKDTFWYVDADGTIGVDEVFDP